VPARCEVPPSRRTSKGKALGLGLGVLDLLVGLLARVAGLSLGVGTRTACPQGLADARRQIGEITAREFVVDVKSRNALAEGLEVIVGAKCPKVATRDAYATLAQGIRQVSSQIRAVGKNRAR